MDCTIGKEKPGFSIDMQMGREAVNTALAKRLHVVSAWFYRPGQFYRIPFGLNRGCYFEYDPTVLISIMLGLHEPNTAEAFRQLVQPGMVTVDLGANRGYFSIMLARLVGESGLVYAFEPLPDNFAALQRTLQRNSCRQVVALPKAVGRDRSPVRLYVSHTPYMSSVDSRWAGTAGGYIQVEGIDLDAFFKEQARPPDLIKMDIEGGGANALDGMMQTVAVQRPMLLLESHTPDEDRAIGRVLQDNAYQAYRIGSRIPLLRLDADYRDPNGVWGTVLGVPPERLTRLSQFDPRCFQRWRLGQRH